MRDLRAGQIADRFAEDQMAVVMDAGLDVVTLELAGHALGSFLESLQIVRRPPVVEVPLRIDLRSLIVESMADLVTDDDTDRAVVHRIDRVDVEGRRLQDPRGKNDLVELRVVVRVRSWRRHAPASAIDRLPDPGAIVGAGELPAGHNVVPQR